MAQDLGDECGDPIAAVEGENIASGSVQYFRYTAQVDGHILVSSEPDSLGNEADTYVRVFSSCDLENDMLAESDDYSSNSKLSSLVINVSLGDTIIFECNSFEVFSKIILSIVLSSLGNQFKWSL